MVVQNLIYVGVSGQAEEMGIPIVGFLRANGGVGMLIS